MTNVIYLAGQPSLIGISAVDGNGRLGKDLSGSAEWLMIPYSHAAPQDDTQYDVGGRLSYSVGGSEFSVPLLPDTITVKPNPSIVVHYFHEKYVRGDDPMTPEVEPIVPFTLAVMVMNAGYGVARNLKISSAQPEIIENEKGLLVTFKIIGSQIGNQPMSPSMTVNFGDIGSFETKTARWLLTSTLQGTFYNYSATFENINPLGDPQLSLLDELGYHELVHVVQINDGPDGANTVDDNLGDFLVNDRVDQNGIPEFLYNSANGSDAQSVLYANVSGFNLIEIFSRGSKTYKVVELTEIVNTSSWTYSRVINNITSPYSADNEYLLQVVREDQRLILVEQNAWQTTHILDLFLYHMLDYTPESQNETVVANYNLTFGPRNMYPPKFNASSHSGSVALNAPKKTFVLKLAAYDVDTDAIHFRLANSNFSLFSIKTTGEIEVNEPLKEEGQVDFEVIVEDSGIPSKSTSTSVSVTITGPGTTGTTASSTSSSSYFTTPGNVSTHRTSSIETTAVSSATSTTTTVKSASTSLIANITELTTSTNATFTKTASSTSVTPVSSTTQPDSTQSNVTSSVSAVTDTSPTSTMGSTVSPTISPTVSTTPSNATKYEEEKGTPSWVIPTAIGAAVFVVILIFVAALIIVLRRKKSPKSPAIRSNSYTYNPQT